MAAFQELKEALEIERVNDELLKYLASSHIYIIYYSKKYGIPIPEGNKIIELMDKAIEIKNKLPTRNQQHFKYEDDSTEPYYIPLLAQIMNIV